MLRCFFCVVFVVSRFPLPYQTAFQDELTPFLNTKSRSITLRAEIIKEKKQRTKQRKRRLKKKDILRHSLHSVKRLLSRKQKNSERLLNSH